MNTTGKELKKKGILLLAATLLFLLAAVYMTFAWFTKMTSVSGLEFDTAKWDFRSNYAVDTYQINVYTYENVRSGKAAPGTAGYIPVLLQATESDVDVDYQISVDKSTMSPEFRERIWFFKDKAMTQRLDDTNVLTGTIPFGQSVTVNIYWKWIYEFSEIPEYCASEDRVSGETALSFDAFDTCVGKNPERYAEYMTARLNIAGNQAEPDASCGVTETDSTSWESQEQSEESSGSQEESSGESEGSSENQQQKSSGGSQESSGNTQPSS